MKPLKYIISSVYLYDNQLKFDYLLLHNEDRLPYLLSQKLNQIYHDPEWILLKSNKERIQELLHRLSLCSGVVMLAGNG